MTEQSAESPEEILMDQITAALENHGYLPRIRAGLKVAALKKAQSMVADKQLPPSDSISPKKLTGKDVKIANMCMQLFEMCNMKKTAEMLAIEADFAKEALPAKNGIPVICSLIE